MDQDDDHRDDCARRTHGLGCNCETMAAREQVQTKINAIRREIPQGLPDSGRSYALPEGKTTTENGGYHTSRVLPQAIHEGAREDCPECQPAPVPDPEQLCFAIATKTGTLVTRDGRPLWATRKLWSGLPELAAQIIPITGAPPIGSMPLMTDKAGPDIVGRLLELLDKLEAQTTDAAVGLENLSLIISQRIHFVELLDRAAAMIDPDSPAQLGGVTHEARLDWLAKWREVIGR
jgi:hypothetical protein